jgi:alpha-amylase
MMGVLMQAFYWDCPSREGVEHAWWERVTPELPALAATGFTALWLPPVSKGMSARGMGYDPYDYYDLGDFDQKGSPATWFGTRQALDALISAARANGIDVYADLVLNHCSGADAQELNPISGQMGWTKFTPESGRFLRDWNSFHPSEYESWDDATFAGFPDLCHRNPSVYAEVLAYVKWLVEEVGFDGFRYDFVKGYGEEGRGTGMIGAIQEYRYRRVGPDHYKPFGVVEYWDEQNVDAIGRYVDGVNFWNDNPVSAFDFPLRHRLARMCNDDTSSLRELTNTGTMLARDPARAVTFVENHDIVRDAPIVRDKMLAYAYILTHEGYPCVFWEDYFVQGLARAGEASGIEALVQVHEARALGASDVLHVDDGLYIMQRRGLDGRGGLVLAINSTGNAWRGEWVTTAFAGATLTPVAYGSSREVGIPQAKVTDAGGRADFWAPPRGYAVYARVG